MKKNILLEGLNCAHCASLIEQEISAHKEVTASQLNFINKTLKVEFNPAYGAENIFKDITHIVHKHEPSVKISDKEALSSDDGHHPSHSHNNTSSDFIRFGIGLLFFIAALLLKTHPLVEFTLFMISYLLIGGEVLLKAGKNILRGQIFDENFLMGIATIGAFAIGEYPEGVAVMLFYQVGEFFQELAVNRSRKSIKALLDLRPDYANLKVGDSIEKVNPEEVMAGATILVQPGEKIPLDGVVIDGRSMVDTSALTGESVPRSISPNTEVLSGMINKNGIFTVKVTKPFSESTLAKIFDLVENASAKKAPTEQFITKFARYYTPGVVFSALALAVLPPLFTGDSFSDWFYRALIFLVISCPCALVVSIPLGFFGGIGGASKKGILIKGGNYLEALNNVDIAVFDKTGTLTKGLFEVVKIQPFNGYTEENLLQLAAYAENHSSHPIAVSIRNRYARTIDASIIKSYDEQPGYGIEALVDDQVVLIGNHKLMTMNQLSPKSPDEAGTIVHMAIDKTYAGYLVIADELKDDAKTAIDDLKTLGVRQVIMLTGDHQIVGERIAHSLGLTDVYSELLPHEKVEKLEWIEQSKKKGAMVFVGDGINDAPVLARADVGVAMGGLGSDAAIEAADVVIMNDAPSKLAEAIRIARKTRVIVYQNIIFAFAVKGFFLLLGALGYATMWEAVFADVGVAVIAILNAMRALKS